jgi:hypothetical protein
VGGPPKGGFALANCCCVGGPCENASGGPPAVGGAAAKEFAVAVGGPEEAGTPGFNGPAAAAAVGGRLESGVCPNGPEEEVDVVDAPTPDAVNIGRGIAPSCCVGGGPPPVVVVAGPATLAAESVVGGPANGGRALPSNDDDESPLDAVAVAGVVLGPVEEVNALGPPPAPNKGGRAARRPVVAVDVGGRADDCTRGARGAKRGVDEGAAVRGVGAVVATEAAVVVAAVGGSSVGAAAPITGRAAAPPGPARGVVAVGAAVGAGVNIGLTGFTGVLASGNTVEELGTEGRAVIVVAAATGAAGVVEIGVGVGVAVGAGPPNMLAVDTAEIRPAPACTSG